jgi:hypothetical protein
MLTTGHSLISFTSFDMLTLGRSPPYRTLQTCGLAQMFGGNN